jgi:hypothetical protein
MAPAQTTHFRVPLHWGHYAKWCADSRIALRLLAHRTPDSGQFRGLWGEEMLGKSRLRTLIWQTAAAKLLSLLSPLAISVLGDSPSVEIQASLGSSRGIG